MVINQHTSAFLLMPEIVATINDSIYDDKNCLVIAVKGANRFDC